MRFLALSAAVIATMVAGAGTAGADPTAPPAPPYQILTPDGPQFPGAQIYPPRCLHAMRACGFTLDPGTMTWRPSGG
jgi:hypothetical protein